MSIFRRLVSGLLAAILIACATTSPKAQETAVYVPFLSYSYKVVRPGDDSVFDYSDRVFAIVEDRLVLTSFRFSEVYANLLYSPDVMFVRRPFYEELVERRSAGAAVAGTRVKLNTGIVSIKNAEHRRTIEELDRRCSTRSFPHKDDRSVRIFDYSLEAACLVDSDASIVGDLLTYLRHSLIANDIEVHGARELFSAHYDRRATTEAVFRDILSRGFQSGRFSDSTRNISVRNVSFSRPWFQQDFFESYVSGRYGMYRNEFNFGPSKVRAAPRKHCFPEAITTICNKTEAEEHCVIESVMCTRFPDILLSIGR
jgi:hypothetical protein